VAPISFAAHDALPLLLLLLLLLLLMLFSG
jgi:hypothetical protein